MLPLCYNVTKGLIIMETKACTKCKGVLTSNNFSKNKNSKDGLEPYCKECRKKVSKKYNENNKELIIKKRRKNYEKNSVEIRAKVKKHLDENKERILKSRREQYEENKESEHKKQKEWRKNNNPKIIEQSRKYYEKHKNIILEKNKKYTKENREVCNAIHQRSRSAKKLLLSTLTNEQWQKIKLDFNDKCAYCNEELPLAQEHFVPLSEGGEYTHNNIIPSCRSCNSSKRNKDFFEWYPNYKHYSKQRENKILKYLGYKNNIQQLSIL